MVFMNDAKLCYVASDARKATPTLSYTQYGIISASHSSVSTHCTEHSLGPSVGLSDRIVYCGKTADWIRMPFVMVSGVGPGIDVQNGGPHGSRIMGGFWGYSPPLAQWYQWPNSQEK